MKITKATCVRLATLASFAGLLAVCGCSTTAPLTTLSPVGPKPPGIRSTGPIQGYVKVYSATEQYCNSDGGFMYYPHTRYSILNPNGTRYKWVDNRSSDTDETPQKVALPVGAYYVLAESELDGLVKVPVIIKGGQTTVVNLERGMAGDGDSHRVDASRGVKSPSGQVVGWRAAS